MRRVDEAVTLGAGHVSSNSYGGTEGPAGPPGDVEDDLAGQERASQPGSGRAQRAAVRLGPAHHGTAANENLRLRRSKHNPVMIGCYLVRKVHVRMLTQ